MKKSISLIVLILIFVAGMTWAETAKDWFKKGSEAYKAKNYDEAIKCLTKAIAINPNCAEVHYNLGLAYRGKGMLDKAISEYKKAIAIEPNIVVVHYNLGNAYHRKGMLDKAISEYKKAIAIEPSDASAHYNLGITYGMKGFDSLSADYFYRAGLLYLKQGDKEDVLRSYRHWKRIKTEKLEKDLYKKPYPELKQKKSEPSK